MMEPRRKIRSAASLSLVSALILAAACFMAACQPTPEEPIVGDKGEQYIEDMLHSGEDSSPGEDTEFQYEAPQMLDYSLSGEVEGVRTMVRIRADILVPEQAPPVVSVQPVDIPYETVDGLLELLQKDRLLYDMDTCAIVSFKNDVQSRIDHYERELSLAGEDDHESASFYREQLKQLYIELEKAPATIEEANEMLASGEIVSNREIAPDDGAMHLPGEGETVHLTRIQPFELTQDNYRDKFFTIAMGMCTNDPASLMLNIRLDARLPQILEYRRTTGPPTLIVNDPQMMNGLEFSVEEAIALTEPIANAFDEDLALMDVSPAAETTDTDALVPYGYQLIYTRDYNGVPANYAISANQNQSKEPSPQYNKEYPQEYLSMVVGIHGIDSIEYTAPQQITRIESSRAKLLPFEQIREKFDQYIVLTKNNYDTYIRIEKIRLGMMRIARPDSGEYLVIPVWDFYGNSIGATGVETYTDDEYWEMIAPLANRSFVTINAIDGSVIDRELGY